MVPTIYPLETLHNALSLRQVSEFLSRVCQRHTDAQVQASADSSGPSSTVSSAGPSSPTAADGNCQFGFSDQYSVSSQATEGSQGLRLLEECPGNKAQGLTVEGGQEPSEPNQCPQEPLVEASRPCQDIPEADSHLCQQMPDGSPLYPENQDIVNQSCQEVPRVGLPCQKVSEEACQFCPKNALETSQPCQKGPMEGDRLAPRFPEGASGLAQEILLDVGKPTQEIPKESSQSRLEFSAEVGRLTQESSMITLSQKSPEVENPSREFPGEGDQQGHEASEELHPPFRAVPEVISPLPAQSVPQTQRLSSDSSPLNQSPTHDQHPPFPPATQE